MARTSRTLLLALLLALAGCASIPYERPGVVPEAVRPADGSDARRSLNARVYDAATGYVQRLFYRDDFGGVDFAAEAAARRAAAVAQRDETGLYAELGALLDLLDDDHSYALGPTARDRMEAHRAGEARASYGIVLTAVGDERIVARVRADGPAARAGVLPGWRMLSVAGQPVLFSAPPQDGRTDRVVFADEHGAEHALDLTAVAMAPLPPFERRDLAHGVTYLRFDRFDRATRAWFAQQMASLAEAPGRGLVLDLRGNGGGVVANAALIHAFFHPQRQDFAVLKRRFVSRRLYASPPAHVYAGPLAVLLGPASASASELLAARLRETRRATLVGQTSRGAVVGTRGIELPDGGLLHVGMIVMTTAGGQVLEKVGVAPDVEVPVDWRAVRQGRDPELDAALAALAAAH